MNRKYIVALVAGAFIMVLFLNTYFNLTSGIAINKYGKTLEDKFYLSGPDPYYNMRLLEITLKTGKFPFIGGVHGDKDPLLNYPLKGTGGRPPLFTMITIGIGKIFSLFMNDTDAMGYAMQFVPALYGALLVIPVYFIASRLFNRKAGIIAAWLVPLIPIHLSSGHGSAFTLYDTDSAILLAITTTIMFLVLAIKEEKEEKSLIFAALAGVFAAAVVMIWVAAEYIFSLIALYAIIQMIFDIFTNKIEAKTVKIPLVALVTGYIVSFPILYVKKGISLSVYLFAPIAVAIFGAVYLWIKKKNIPWIVSIPSIAIVGGASAAFLYVIRNTTNRFLQPLTYLSNILFGSGIYGKKVSLTIAEASSFGFSRTVMSFGPVLYWLGWIGFFYMLYIFYKKKWKKEYVILAVWFLVEAWLTHKAGRFLNDLVPLMSILGAASLWLLVSKLKFKEMIKNLKGLGGGWYGFKRAVKTRHVLGAIFIAFFVIFPNGWLSFDASLPSTMKREFHTNKLGAFGLGVHTEQYWVDALSWLRSQTQNYSLDKKPAFISWWDYGFYCVAVAKTPTVADNFQEGIPPAANFHTSLSEDEAIAVLIVRLAEGDMNKHDGKISNDLLNIFQKYFGENATTLANIIEDPEKYAPSYGEVISKQYKGKKYHVRADNARYHDAVKMILKLDDENITRLYMDVQNVTGYNIRYYGVEGYDINIFNVFDFLADKGSFGYETTEDKFFKLWYIANNTQQKFTPDQVKNITQSMTRQDIQKIYGRFIPYTQRKDAFYKSMVYRVYLGDVSKSIFENYSTDYRLSYFMNPTAGLRHFYAQYVSPVTNEKPYYYVPRPGSLCTGLPAVVIAKYYEGAKIRGKITSKGEPFQNVIVEVQQNVSIMGMNKAISHDNYRTGADGNFSVIAPAGNVIINIYNGEGANKVELKKLYLNISEEQAERKENWKINLGTIDIPRGKLKGIVFWDKDGDGKYNASIDKKIDAKVMVGNKEITTHNGVYEIKDLLPASYTINAEKNGYEIRNAGNAIVRPNETAWYNISMVPSKVKVTGKVWYDKNGNGRMDANESVPNTPVNFTVISAPDKNAKNATIYTNTTGYYDIALSPAKYRVMVKYTTKIGNESITYSFTGTINIRVGDKPKTYNIQLRKE